MRLARPTGVVSFAQSRPAGRPASADGRLPSGPGCAQPGTSHLPRDAQAVKPPHQSGHIWPETGHIGPPGWTHSRHPRHRGVRGRDPAPRSVPAHQSHPVRTRPRARFPLFSNLTSLPSDLSPSSPPAGTIPAEYSTPRSTTRRTPGLVSGTCRRQLAHVPRSENPPQSASAAPRPADTASTASRLRRRWTNRSATT